MPFGWIFAALFFGFVCGWVGIDLIAGPGTPSRVAGVSLVVTGVSLAVGLLQGRPWARWAGAVAALIVALLGRTLVDSAAEVIDHLLLFAALAAAGLLLLPATGAPSPQAQSAPRQWGAVVGLTTALGMAGLVGSFVWALPGDSSTPTATELPASAIARRISWQRFDDGLRRAREENKPMLVTFVTDWCPYCTKMERNTWRASSVIERMSGLVAVKVDAEATGGPAGFPASSWRGATASAGSRRTCCWTARAG